MKGGLPCLLLAYILTGSGLPSPIRQDETFWNMLTNQARQVLMQIPVRVRDECVDSVGHRMTGGIYHGATNAIELCGVDFRAELDWLRHEALHALDWAPGYRASDTNGFVKAVPKNLEAVCVEAYREGGGTWFRNGELYAMVPIVVGWDFEALPDDVAAFYAPWFEGIE